MNEGVGAGNDGENQIDHGDEEEEEEPRLKYQRLGASVTDLLAKTSATCLCVSDKILALGTHEGCVHVLDYTGNEVKRLEAHKQTVNAICFDEAVEYIASCSDDGTVVIQGFYTDEVSTFNYRRPVKTVALDPRYGSRKTREFITGGLAGQLLLNSRGWLGPKDSVLHFGEGPIHVARWAGTLVAWANDLGVKVYDMTSHQRIAYIERPRVSLQTEAAECHLFWEGDSLLYMGWGNTVKVARAQLRSTGPSGLTADAVHSVEIVASLQMDYIVAGIAPFGEDIAVLAYVEAGNADAAASHAGNGAAAAAAGSNGHNSAEAPRPELKIVTWQNEELASDALSIHGYEHYQGNDYSLAVSYPPRRSAPAAGPSGRSRGAGYNQWWADGDEPMYYVISPKDVVVGRPRDGDDQVAWLLEHKRFQQALAIVESTRGLKPSTHEQMAERYLESLMSERRYEEAAALTPRLLKEDAAAWERWLYLFAQARQLGVLAPRLPTRNPTLRSTAYQMVLHSFLLAPADHPRLLALLTAWPPDLLSIPSLTEAVVQRIRGPGGDSDALLQAAAHLYQLRGRFDMALAILLRLKRADVFAFLEQHALFPLLRGKHVAQLLRIDEARAISLLVDRHQEVPASAVVPALQAASLEAEEGGDEVEAEAWRRRLHVYLDRLFQRDSAAGAEFHGLQVGLYADYEPERLMGFLVASQWYELEEAFRLCQERGLIREQVFILGRMGNARQALSLIIESLGNVPQAIDFVQMQRDPDLWELLISLTLPRPDLVGALMDHMGGYFNPLRLVQQIPEGMAVPRLRDRLVGIIADYRTQTSLREGCTVVLRHDCLVLAQRLYRTVQRAMARLYIWEGGAPGRDDVWASYETATGRRAAADVADVPGPAAAKDLYVQPRRPDAPAPNKVWVGLSQAALANAETSAVPSLPPSGRRANRRKVSLEETLPPLPSLLTAQHSPAVL